MYQVIWTDCDYVLGTYAIRFNAIARAKRFREANGLDFSVAVIKVS